MLCSDKHQYTRAMGHFLYVALRLYIHEYRGAEHRNHHGGGGKDQVETLCLFVVKFVLVQECSFLAWLMGANKGVPV